MHHSLSEIGHESDKCGVPLIRDLGEGGGAGCHQDLANAVFELFDAIFVHSNESLRGDLFCAFILQLPHSIFLRKLLLCSSLLGEYPNLEAAHIEEHIWVVLRIDRHKAVFPLNRSQGTR